MTMLPIATPGGEYVEVVFPPIADVVEGVAADCWIEISGGTS